LKVFSNSCAGASAVKTSNPRSISDWMLAVNEPSRLRLSQATTEKPASNSTRATARPVIPKPATPTGPSDGINPPKSASLREVAVTDRQPIQHRKYQDPERQISPR